MLFYDPENFIDLTIFDLQGGNELQYGSCGGKGAKRTSEVSSEVLFAVYAMQTGWICAQEGA